jgi:hypothetical protein
LHYQEQLAELARLVVAGAAEHSKKIAQFIATFEADIINLVEVEGCSNLKSLISDGGAPSLRGAYTAYLKQGTDAATGQDVALVTKCASPPRCYTPQRIRMLIRESKDR